VKSDKRQQIRLILEQALSAAEKNLKNEVKKLHAENAAKRCLQSGATLKRHIEIIDTVGQNYVSSTLDAIADVSMESEAFAIYGEGHVQLLTMMRKNLQNDKVFAVCTDNKPNSALALSIWRLFAAVEGQLNRLKDLRRLSFTKPEPISDVMAEIRNGLDSPSVTTNQIASTIRGGRPAAKHWDSMWAAIASQLYLGDLKPKTQAEIEKAMIVWLENGGFSAADSTVRKRARLLWQEIEHDEN